MADVAVLSGAEGAEAAGAEVPTVQQASGSGDAPGARPGEVETQAKESRPRLPGVQQHNDGDPWVTRKVGDKARDAQGRFTIPEGSEEFVEPGAEDARKPELPADAEPTKAKFKFAGAEFESQEKAEQNFKSLQGMFRHKDGQIKTLTDERNYGYNAANAWESKYRELERRLSEGGGGQTNVGQKAEIRQGAQNPGGQATAGGFPEVESILNDIDTDAFEVLATQAGLPQAGKYLAGETLRVVLNKVIPALRAEYDQKLEPFMTDRQTQESVAQAEGVVQSLVQYRGSNGEPAFPELTDPVKVRQIGAMWRESGLPVEHVLTPAGLMQAVAMYRMVQSQNAQVVTPPQPQRVAEIPGGSGVAAAAASVSGDGRVGVPGGAGSSNVSPEHRRLIESLNDASFMDRSLGFMQHRKDRSF